jgi:hypothetical protein
VGGGGPDGEPLVDVESAAAVAEGIGTDDDIDIDECAKLELDPDAVVTLEMGGTMGPTDDVRAAGERRRDTLAADDTATG